MLWLLTYRFDKRKGHERRKAQTFKYTNTQITNIKT